jgi:hypothetical protein
MGLDKAKAALALGAAAERKAPLKNKLNLNCLNNEL